MGLVDSRLLVVLACNDDDNVDKQGVKLRKKAAFEIQRL